MSQKKKMSRKKKQDMSAKAVNLFGGRTILLINLCALFVASVMAAERMFVEQHVLGFIKPLLWQLFVPVAVMFIIRRKFFSYVFLFLYSTLALLIVPEIWMIEIGTPIQYPGGSLGFREGLLFPLSLACLLIYLAATAIRVLPKLWKK